MGKVKSMPIVVLVTTPNREVAEKIARKLVETRLAACINIVDGIKSMYWWKGRIEEDNEVLMIIKTRLDIFNDLVEEVKRNHVYEVPEVIALPVIIGYRDYINWLEKRVYNGAFHHVVPFCLGFSRLVGSSPTFTWYLLSTSSYILDPRPLYLSEQILERGQALQECCSLKTLIFP